MNPGSMIPGTGWLVEYCDRGTWFRSPVIAFVLDDGQVDPYILGPDRQYGCAADMLPTAQWSLLPPDGAYS